MSELFWKVRSGLWTKARRSISLTRQSRLGGADYLHRRLLDVAARSGSMVSAASRSFAASRIDSIDEAEITARVVILADFIEGARTRYSLTRAPIAIGFSNGAIIMAAALLLTRPWLLAGALLSRPLSPFRHDIPAGLDGTPVLLIDGEKDTRRSPGDGALLAERLTRNGAAVSHHVLPVGHSIAARDREIARVWPATGGV